MTKAELNKENIQTKTKSESTSKDHKTKNRSNLRQEIYAFGTAETLANVIVQPAVQPAVQPSLNGKNVFWVFDGLRLKYGQIYTSMNSFKTKEGMLKEEAKILIDTIAELEQELGLVTDALQNLKIN